MDYVIIFSIVIAIICIFGIYKYFFEVREHFEVEGVNLDATDLQDLIKKHTMIPSKKIATTSFIYNYEPTKITGNQLSFWLPYLTGLQYSSIGTAVGLGENTRPDKKYTAITSTDLSLPKEIIKLYQFGRDTNIVMDELKQIEAVYFQQKNNVARYKRLIDLYNNADTNTNKGVYTYTMINYDAIYNYYIKKEYDERWDDYDLGPKYNPARYANRKRKRRRDVNINDNYKPFQGSGANDFRKGNTNRLIEIETNLQNFLDNLPNTTYATKTLGNFTGTVKFSNGSLVANTDSDREENKRYLVSSTNQFTSDKHTYGKKYVVDNFSNYNTNLDMVKLLYQTNPQAFGIKQLEIPPYMKLVASYSYDESGTLNRQEVAITGDFVSKVRFQTEDEGKDTSGDVDYSNLVPEKDVINLINKLNTDEIIRANGHVVYLYNYEKNPDALAHYQSKLTEVEGIFAETQSAYDKLKAELDGSFSIWKAIPPEGFKCFGNIINPGSLQPNKFDIKCVPERCAKVSRDWRPTDIVFTYTSDTDRLTIYKNPFHATLFSVVETRVGNEYIEKDRMGLDEAVIRLYPCLKKCSYVDKLKEADDCSKTMCYKQKKIISTAPLVNKKAEELSHQTTLSDIKKQEDYIEQLKKTIYELETKHDKFKSVNTEHNRHKLNKHIRDTGNLHRDTINRLYNTKDAVAVNINAPGGAEGLKELLQQYLKKYAEVLGRVSKTKPGQPLPGCTNWTEFKKNNYCKYSNPPCFGCVNPT